MEPLVLEISGEILEGLRLPEGRAREELRREFAVFLVKEGLLPPHKASLVAGVERLEFEDLLARRHVSLAGEVHEVISEIVEAEHALKRRSP